MLPLWFNESVLLNKMLIKQILRSLQFSQFWQIVPENAGLPALKMKLVFINILQKYLKLKGNVLSIAHSQCISIKKNSLHGLIINILWCESHLMQNYLILTWHAKLKHFKTRSKSSFYLNKFFFMSLHETGINWVSKLSLAWLDHLLGRFVCNRVIVDASSNPPLVCEKFIRIKNKSTNCN